MHDDIVNRSVVFMFSFKEPLKPNDKLSFVLFDTAYLLWFLCLTLTFSSNLEFTKLFARFDFWHVEAKFFLWDYSEIWHMQGAQNSDQVLN